MNTTYYCIISSASNSLLVSVKQPTLPNYHDTIHPLNSLRTSNSRVSNRQNDVVYYPRYLISRSSVTIICLLELLALKSNGEHQPIGSISLPLSG